jgi:3-hydroxyisobutyrate dehydrogenase-like beta-hydroxyacid dehydrogenase
MTDRTQVVGLLHPGAMGAAIGAQLRRVGTRVLWYPAGRSDATVARAAEAGLESVATLDGLLGASDVVLSVCPPAAAEDLAGHVAELGYAGVYVEANAISPERSRRIAARLDLACVLDAAVVGSPPRGGKRPCLYLAGDAGAAAQVEGLFAGTDVRTRVLGGDLGAASALKLSYSAYQKASRVLAALAYASAVDHDAGEELLEIAARRSGGYLQEVDYIPKTAARAWRWGPELLEAAELLEAEGMPGGMLRSAAEALNRWYPAKDTTLSVADALGLLHQTQPDVSGPSLDSIPES